MNFFFNPKMGNYKLASVMTDIILLVLSKLTVKETSFVVFWNSNKFIIKNYFTKIDQIGQY